MNPILKDRRLLLLFITLFVTDIGFGVIIPAIPYLARSLQATALQQGLVITFLAVGQMISAPFWGSLSDRLGRKPILMLGLGGFCIAYLIMPWAPNMWVMLAFRFLAGFAVGAIFPTAFAMTADLTNKEHRPMVMAWLGGANALGFSIGPAIGGLVMPLGIKAPFILTSIMGILSMVFGLFLLPNVKVIPSVIAEKLEETSRLKETVFLIFKSPISIFLWLALVLSYAASNSLSMIGYYAMDKLQATQEAVATVFTVQGASGAIVQFFLVALAVKYLKELLSINVAFLAGMLGFLLMIISPAMTLLYIGVALVAAGNSVGRPILMATISSRTDKAQGVSQGVFLSFDSFGRILGPAIAGYLYGMKIQFPFVAGVAACLLGVALSLFAYVVDRKKTARRSGAQQPAV